MKITTIDAREALARGGSPLDGVLQAWEALPAGEGLCVIAPFEPAPMLSLFSARGVQGRCVQAGPEEYHLQLGPKAC